MKYLVLVPDGMADEPHEALGGRTPMQAQDTPHMDALARAGELGLARTVPEGMSPGSDIANLSLFGYDPAQYFTGRAPLEAANMGLDLGDGLAYRCNLVTLADETMVDFTSGHITSAEAAALIAAVEDALGGDGIHFHAGVSYRHIMVGPHTLLEAECTPPHDITGRPVAPYLPKGPAAQTLIDLMVRSRPVLAAHPVNARRRADGKREATSIWLWGQGTRPALPRIDTLYGITGAVVSAVDLVKGIGRLAGYEVLNVPGATGFLDTNYAGKVDAALRALDRVDLVYLHIEATDETGHMGDPALKMQAVADFDGKVVGPLLVGLGNRDVRILIAPDHPTPLRVRSHTLDPVPYILYDSRHPSGSGRPYTEQDARETGVYEPHAHRLLGRLLQR